MSSAELTLHNITSRRTLYLVFATLTLLVLGLIYAWSIFAGPIGSAFTDYQPYLPQVFQISMFSFCLSALVGAQIVKRQSAKLSIIIAAVLMAVGFICTARFTGEGIWALFLFYGVFTGSGCGIAYNAIISLVNPWFPDRIGLASGIMMMGFGISSLVFGSLATVLFGLVEWTTVFLIIAATAFVVLLLLALIVRPAPGDIGARLGVTATAAGVGESPTQQRFLMKTKVFWVFWIWGILIVAAGLTLIGTSKQGAEALALDESVFVGFSAILVGLVSTMNGLSRIFNGALFDKIGLVPVMMLSSVVCFFCALGLSVSLALGIGPLYIASAILIALPYGSAPVLSAAFARQRYGAKNFASNLSIITCCIAIAAALNIVLVTVLGSPAGDNGPLIYGILAGLVVLSFVGTLVFRGLYKNDLATIKEELA
ncbi:MAG: MFS transporter [Coriobacteriia bacterium]|nr:MFS transporter [Coriobacteriia bacterium]